MDEKVRYLKKYGGQNGHVHFKRVSFHFQFRCQSFLLQLLKLMHIIL